MATLLMRLQGVQAWGSSSRFPYRRGTDQRPTKSGVLGLMACALGRGRDEDISDLAALRFGVRVDVSGKEWMDFHTVQNAPRAGGGTKYRHLTRRYYLSPETTFLVGLEGKENLLRSIQAAVRNPVWLLYLGRRACPPMAPVWLPDDLRQEGLKEALLNYPWLGKGGAPERLLIELPDPEGEQRRQDQPLEGERRFAARYVATVWVPTPTSEVAVQEEI